MVSNIKISFSLFLISILLLSFSICNATTLKETFKKQITCNGIPGLEVKNSNGRIEVFSWDKNEIEIIAHIRVEGNESHAQKMLDRINIEVEQDGDDIYVETVVPDGLRSGGGLLSWIFGNGHISYSVEYEINVPLKSDLNLQNTNGSVLVENVEGNIDLHSTNGKIKARDVSGLVRCNTTNGSIRAEINKIQSNEEMIFRTTNGSIKLYLPEEYGGYADLKTTNGHIDSDFRLSSDDRSYRRSRKSFRGEFGDGHGEITCKTTNGSIYLLKNN